MKYLEIINNLFTYTTRVGNVYLREFWGVINLTALLLTIVFSSLIFIAKPTKSLRIIVFSSLGLALFVGGLYYIEQIFFWEGANGITLATIVAPLTIMVFSYSWYSRILNISKKIRVVLGLLFVLSSIIFIQIFVLMEVFSFYAMINWGG